METSYELLSDKSEKSRLQFWDFGRCAMLKNWWNIATETKFVGMERKMGNIFAKAKCFWQNKQKFFLFRFGNDICFRTGQNVSSFEGALMIV